jgi:predicted dehydrogenase
MTEMFESVKEFIRTKGEREVIVVLGGGQWALQYANALHWFMAQQRAVTLLIYQSEYGVGQKGYHRYLYNTITNILKAEQLGAVCVDLSRLSKEEELGLPNLIHPKAVFIVTPPEAHCRNAIEWIGETDYIFIEKPFDVNPDAITELQSKLTELKITKVFGFDHYAARLKRFLNKNTLQELGFGSRLTSFDFEMFESEPRGLAERAPSISSGMMFDMASHALPILSWLTTSLQDLKPVRLFASSLVSPNSTPYISSETFGRLEFGFTGADFVGNESVKGEIRIGKGVGVTDSKVVTLTDENGKQLRLDQWFMRARGPDPKVSKPIHEKVIHRLMEQVISGDLEDSEGIFETEVGLSIVGILNQWTSPVTKHLRDNQLMNYHLGMRWEDICAKQTHRNVFQYD